jgi:transketolase
VSDGALAFARAAELAPGTDLAIVSAGAGLALALEVSREFQRVGLGARVLDFASVKPFDQKALVRAARETGAILAIEEHSAATGLGAEVATAVSESRPVPVRTVGALEVRLAPADTPAEARAAYGITRERALEEAWALLRGRAKVT